jgi:transposase
MSISELTQMPERARRIEVFTGAGRRRSWSADEKAAIVAESYAPGKTVCGVARRHGLTPAQHTRASSSLGAAALGCGDGEWHWP